ncbi:hypothetical protein [Spirochaeta cellobiosiphila]|uniref:hypothetical protein n=1 Tax=Spirochaeta cellobiosiphila TaxID=504483 RepID=UPI000490EADD|nr:hypothetical protein [Spirochaeta cellobiosiphila]
MAAIQLILYIIVLVVSLISMISFYSAKSKSKKVSKEVIKNIQPLRSLSQEEAEAVNKIYQVSIQAGVPVYAIQGEYYSTSLSVNHQKSDEIHTIGGVHVQKLKNIEKMVGIDNHAEIIELGNKKGALIISLNESFNVVKEELLQQALNSTDSTYREQSTASDIEVGQTREPSEEEIKWLNSDYRVLGNMLSIAFLFASLLVPNIQMAMGLFAIGLILFALLIIPAAYKLFNHKKYSQKLIRVRGPLNIQDNSYSINRFLLELPKPWKEHLQKDQIIEVEGFPMDVSKEQLKVVTIDQIQRITRNEKLLKSNDKNKYLLFSILATVMLLLSIPFTNVPFQVEQINNYQRTRSLQSKFETVEELQNYDIQKGQMIEISSLKTLPNVATLVNFNYGYPVMDENKVRTYPDFNVIKEELRRIEELQETSDFLNLYLLTITDASDYYSFLLTHYKENTENSIEDYLPYYETSEKFQIIRDVVQVLNTLDDDATADDILVFPETGYLKKYFEHHSYSDVQTTVGDMVDEITYLRRDFLEEQSDLIDKEVNAIYNQYLEDNQIFFIRNTTQTPLRFNLDSSDLSLFYKSSYSFDSSDTIQKYDTLPGINKVNNFVEKLKTYPSLDNLDSTMVVSIDKENDPIQWIKVDPIRNYDNINDSMVRMSLYLLMLVGIVYSLVKYALIKKEGI